MILTRICVGPHPLTISQTGRLRYGRASQELTGRRMSASPCWPSPAHPKGGDGGRRNEGGKQNGVNHKVLWSHSHGLVILRSEEMYIRWVCLKVAG